MPTIGPYTLPETEETPAPVDTSTPDPFAPEQPELGLTDSEPQAPVEEVVRTRIEATPELQSLITRRADLAQQQADALNAQAATTEADSLRQIEALSKFQTEKTNLDREEQEVRSRYSQQYEAELGEIRNRQLELESMEPKSFWARQDTGDKILTSFAIILGSVGQGMSGAKENAAVEMLDRVIAEDNRAYEASYTRKLDALKGRRMSLDDKAKLQDRLLGDMHARELAVASHLTTTLQRLTIQAKGEGAKAKAAELLAGIEQARADKDIELQTSLADKITTKGLRQTDGSGLSTPVATLPKDTEKSAGIISDANAKLLTETNKIGAILASLKDPNLSDNDKIRIGQNALKDINTDVVGAEEVSRIGGELEGNLNKITSGAGTGALKGGAALSGVFGGIGLGVGGVGAIAGAGIGAAVGGTLGAIGGGLMGALEAANDPGGIRMSPSVEGFTRRVELVKTKLDTTIKRNELIHQGLRRGLSASQALELAETKIQRELTSKVKPKK